MIAQMETAPAPSTEPRRLHTGEPQAVLSVSEPGVWHQRRAATTVGGPR